MIKQSELNVFNLHYTDRCNYRCRYCFVETNINKEEMSLDELKEIVVKIKDYFIERDMQDGRINLVGGETLLDKPFLFQLVDFIRMQNILVSIVTNGSKIEEDFIKKINGKVDMIGISVDSLDDDTNK